jgi:hypothetical protein
MDIEKSKMSHEILQYQHLVWTKDVWQLDWITLLSQRAP